MHIQLFESTAPSIAGWNSHITGLGQLVLVRGPEKHRSEFARGILEEFRTSAVSPITFTVVTRSNKHH